MLRRCTLCPRQCEANRSQGLHGMCGAGEKIKVARAALHYWEEPCISGSRGSGTIFFSHCNLKCLYCQNHEISHGGFGKEIEIDELTSLFFMLQDHGAHNINLVSPTHYVLQIREALLGVRKKGKLHIPIIYNSNGYENLSALKSLAGLIDIYLPDLKYYNDNLAVKYSQAPSYFKFATEAILEMYRQVGCTHFDINGMAKKGLIIRHLVLPGQIMNTREILRWIADNLPREVYISLMAQYTPAYKAGTIPNLSRTLTKNEYAKAVEAFYSLGLENGYFQDISAASSEYTPPFDLSGISK